MPNYKFNFAGLKSVYLESVARKEPTLAFEVLQGRGRFLFMMFFSSEDKESKDRLFIYLRNTTVLLELKLYGSHRNGIFDAYLKPSDRQRIIDELQLVPGNNTFDFDEFMHRLNASIPATLPLQVKLDAMRSAWPHVSHQLRRVVDEADKTILLDIYPLPANKSPQDKTLRKLYVNTNGDEQAISELIRALKASNTTLKWTDKPGAKAKSLADIMAKIRARKPE